MSTTDQQTLPQPFDLPAPERVVVDISIEPWEDGKSTTGDPGRFPMSVPRAVADHVMRVKHIAAQTSASDFTHVLGALQKETAPARADLAHMDSDYEAAKQAGATEVQLQAITGLQLAARQQTRAQLEAAVNRVIGPVRETLATAERQAMHELEDRPGTRPTDADYAAASDLAKTLDLVPAPVAVPLLMERLVHSPATSGKTGLTAAMLPLLKARQGNPSWQTPEVDDLLRLCQVVTRDSEWHGAHLRLRNAGSTRYALDRLAADALAPHGVEAAASNPFYKGLGAEPANE